MINKLLYITYVNLDGVPGTGSSVRPQKMRDALMSLDIEVKTFDGINNNVSRRKKTVSDINKLLKVWKPDACYIEPPSGPMFYYGDVALIKAIHKMKIPTSIFYRDAYWKYPEYGIEKKQSIKDRIKGLIIKRMQIHQWKVYRNNIDIIYFPSISMAREFDAPNKDTLPPGGFVPDATEKISLSNPLQFIFVGGAAKNHGTFLTLKAFEEFNKNEIRSKLTYVCPKKQWEGLGINKGQYSKWLTVIHTSGDSNLRPLYEKADIALLIAPRTFYRDFAVPIKIYEYMSYLKPIFVTNCTETARVVEENNVGWVVNDNVDDVIKKLDELYNNQDEILKIMNNMKEARSKNLWKSRARKVVEDLDRFK